MRSSATETTPSIAEKPPQRAGDPLALTITLPIPDPLLTVNYRKRMHWRTQARHTKAQRHDAMLAAFGAMADHPMTLYGPMFPRGKVRADVTVYRRPRQLIPDEGARWEWLKPIWDGFQDAGLVENDKQITHGEIAYYPTDPDPRVVIVLTEVAE